MSYFILYQTLLMLVIVKGLDYLYIEGTVHRFHYGRLRKPFYYNLCLVVVIIAAYYYFTNTGSYLTLELFLLFVGKMGWLIYNLNSQRIRIIDLKYIYAKIIYRTGMYRDGDSKKGLLKELKSRMGVKYIFRVDHDSLCHGESATTNAIYFITDGYYSYKPVIKVCVKEHVTIAESYTGSNKYIDTKGRIKSWSCITVLILTSLFIISLFYF